MSRNTPGARKATRECMGKLGPGVSENVAPEKPGDAVAQEEEEKPGDAEAQEEPEKDGDAEAQEA